MSQSPFSPENTQRSSEGPPSFGENRAQEGPTSPAGSGVSRANSPNTLASLKSALRGLISGRQDPGRGVGAQGYPDTSPLCRPEPSFARGICQPHLPQDGSPREPPLPTPAGEGGSGAAGLVPPGEAGSVQRIPRLNSGRGATQGRAAIPTPQETHDTRIRTTPEPVVGTLDPTPCGPRSRA